MNDKNQMVNNMKTDRGLVSVMFADRESAENAYRVLNARGYTGKDIHVLMSDETRKKHFDGTSGGLIDSLRGSELPGDRSKLYESGLKDGHIVMSVKSRNEEDAAYFEEEWRKNKGKEIYR